MKFSLFRQNGALNSGPIFDAFTQGAKKNGFQIVDNDLSADIYVIWSVLWQGRMTNNKKIWEIAKKQNKRVLIIEVGGLKRGITWKLGLNHVNGLGKFNNEESYDIDRPKKLGIFLKNREKKGENILICGQNTKSLQWEHREPVGVWLTNLVNEIKMVSNRKIIFRPHPRDHSFVNSLPNLGIEIRYPRKIIGTYDDFDLYEDFNSSWCVISPCSNPGIHAAIEGIPVFTDKDSLAYPVSLKDLKNIENPIDIDKGKWLVEVCHTEWTKEEIQSGIPLTRIFQLS